MNSMVVTPHPLATVPGSRRSGPAAARSMRRSPGAVAGGFDLIGDVRVWVR